MVVSVGAFRALDNPTPTIALIKIAPVSINLFSASANPRIFIATHCFFPPFYLILTYISAIMVPSHSNMQK